MQRSASMLPRVQWIQRLNAQLEEFRQSNSYRELFGIDGEPIEFEWHISEDLQHCRLSQMAPTCSECGEHFTLKRRGPTRKKEARATVHSLAEDWRRLNMSKLQDGLSAAVQVWSHHARDKRVRGRGCRDFWLAQHDIDSDLADRQEEQDLTLLRAARRRAGHMQLHPACQET